MPYGYYQLVRVVAMIAFAIMAYQYYVVEKVPLAITFCGLALLFQPFIKVALGRTLWNVVDVIVAVLLIVLAFSEFRKKG
jgi:small neutral amino acid transporter SnatA (MarC family)